MLSCAQKEAQALLERIARRQLYVPIRAETRSAAQLSAAAAASRVQQAGGTTGKHGRAEEPTAEAAAHAKGGGSEHATADGALPPNIVISRWGGVKAFVCLLSLF